MLTTEQLERFLAKVYFEPNCGCWLWGGASNKNRYGQFVLNGKVRRAHRVAYEHFREPVPSGLDLDHLCRVRECCNPQHLEPVTRSINAKRGDTGRHNNPQKLANTHCPQGHPYSGDNLVIQKGGGRKCRFCHNARGREIYRKKTQ